MALFYFTLVCTWIKYVHTCKNTVWSLATARRRFHLCICHKIRTQRFPWKTTTEFGWVIWPRSLGARATTRALTRIQCSLAFEKVSICNSDRIMVEENQACGYTQTWQSDRCSRTNTPRSHINLTTPVWTRWASAVTVMWILKEKTLTISQRSRQDLSSCIQCVIQDLEQHEIRQHDVLKDHKSVWLSQYLSFSFKLWSYQKVWAISTSFIVKTETQNATMRGKHDANTCLRARRLKGARIPINCHGKHLGQK